MFCGRCRADDASGSTRESSWELKTRADQFTNRFEPIQSCDLHALSCVMPYDVTRDVLTFTCDENYLFVDDESASASYSCDSCADTELLTSVINQEFGCKCEYSSGSLIHVHPDTCASLELNTIRRVFCKINLIL